MPKTKGSSTGPGRRSLSSPERPRLASGVRLVKLPAVKERLQANKTMPEGQALRGLLIEATLKAIGDLSSVAAKSNVALFLKKYIEGKKITWISREVGVSREWCTKSYRKEAIKVAAFHFLTTARRPPTFWINRAIMTESWGISRDVMLYSACWEEGPQETLPRIFLQPTA
jgi:hypothetical protein